MMGSIWNFCFGGSNEGVSDSFAGVVECGVSACESTEDVSVIAAVVAAAAVATADALL